VLKLHRTEDRSPVLLLLKFIARLAAEGFTPGPPPHITHDTLVIDWEACRHSRCLHCGRDVRSYRPFHNSRWWVSSIANPDLPGILNSGLRKSPGNLALGNTAETPPNSQGKYRMLAACDREGCGRAEEM
jgi:ribosomal protein S14